MLLSCYVILISGQLGSEVPHSQNVLVIKGVMEWPIDSEQLYFWTAKIGDKKKDGTGKDKIDN